MGAAAKTGKAGFAAAWRRGGPKGAGGSAPRRRPNRPGARTTTRKRGFARRWGAGGHNGAWCGGARAQDEPSGGLEEHNHVFLG